MDNEAPMPPPPRARSGRTSEGKSDRGQEIRDIAARLFARKGYRGTSIRDIGDEAGIKGGSLYHHIKSKDALFVELHDAALTSASRKIAEAVARQNDPWDRLQAACSELLAIQSAVDSLTFPLMNELTDVPQDVRAQLIRRRDAFEDLFRDLVAALPLPADIDRSIYRNLLLSQLNMAAHWYRPGRLNTAELASQIIRIYRHSAD